MRRRTGTSPSLPSLPIGRLARSVGMLALLPIVVSVAAAQRPRQQAQRGQQGEAPAPRPKAEGYHTLAELVAKLPDVPEPAFGTPQAVALGAIQLSCLDRLQPKVPPRPVPRDTALADSAKAGATQAWRAQGDTTRGDTARAAAADNRGSNYLWVTTYSLTPANNQTRAFWGCADWHSAVSATWATAYLVKNFPTFALQDLAREKLADHLGASNLGGELAFFDAAARSINPIPFAGQRPLFERPYGFAWLLKLESELDTWPDSAARKWSSNAAPLAHWMADSLGAYLAALPAPVRTGNQNNTAFSMLLALDYATTVGDAPLRDQIEANARRFYLGDRACKVDLETTASRSGRGRGSGRGAGRGGRGAAARDSSADSVNDLSSPAAIAAGRAANTPRFGGGDVISPCATEAALMARVLPTPAFVSWLDTFLPPLESAEFAPLTEPAGGSGAVPEADRTRFSTLSFERAQALERIAHALPLGDARIEALHRLSAIQAARGFQLLAGDVGGVPSVPAFALLYVDARRGPSGVACSCGGASSAVAQAGVAAAHDTASPKEPEYADLASFVRSLPRDIPDTLDAARALSLSAMPLACEDHPQPRPATAPYLWDEEFSPVDSFDTKRAFYGCYDWHSAVNSAWTLVKLLKMYPNMPTAPAIRDDLNRHFGASNVAGEVEFFDKAGTFELPYGYAWFLRLEGELQSWNDPDGQRWAANLQPLAKLLSGRLVTYLDGLKQPVRTGVHPNTAMAMDNSLFYASHFDPQLDTAIRKNAVRLFAKDINCNTAAEPGPSDFQSPCLYEAVIMGELMPQPAFVKWVDRFLPPVQSTAFRSETKLLGLEFAENAHASVASTSHLVGLSLVRGMLLARLAALLPPDDPRVPVLRQIAVVQAKVGLPQIGAVGYDGSHYYATWAMTYFLSMPDLIRGATQ